MRNKTNTTLCTIKLISVICSCILCGCQTEVEVVNTFTFYLADTHIQNNLKCMEISINKYILILGH